MINEPEEILYHLEKAVYLALNGRQGPVWLDIPLDVQGAFVDESDLKQFIPEPINNNKIKGIDNFIEIYKNSKRPIILAGNGVRLSGSIDKLRSFASKNNIPCVVSYLAVDYFEQDNSNYVGRLGIKGDRAGNFAIQNSDFVFAGRFSKQE